MAPRKKSKKSPKKSQTRGYIDAILGTGEGPEVHVVVGQPIKISDLFIKNPDTCDHEYPEGAKFCPECGGPTGQKETPKGFAAELLGPDITASKLRSGARRAKPDPTKFQVLKIKGSKQWVLGVYVASVVPGESNSFTPAAHLNQLLKVVRDQFERSGAYSAGKLSPCVGLVVGG